MFLWYPVLDLARAPRRTARKKGSGYEMGYCMHVFLVYILYYMVYYHPRPQAQARAALTVALGQAVEQLIVIGSFALKERCGWEGNAG